MEKRNGVLYCVGVGPGDPELLTLKAVRTAERCPVLAAPRTRSGEMLALDILRGAVGTEGKTILPLDFSMARDAQTRRRDHEAAAKLLEEQLAAGRDVALLTLGDVSLYATCAYLQDILREKGYGSVMVPGVPSFCAVAARLGESLTEPDLPLHIVPAGAGRLEEALRWPGTKVLMKSGKSWPRVLEALRERGLLEKTSMVSDCGLPGERAFFHSDALPEDAGYFATVIVKDTAAGSSSIRL